MLTIPTMPAARAAAFEDQKVLFRDAVVTDDAPAASPQVLLLANDMMAGRGVLSLLVRFAGKIAQAANGTDAVELARSGGYDVVVVDIRPDVLGYEAVCQMRVAGIDLPVLFISARSGADGLDRARAAGADDAMALPASHDILAARIAALTIRSARPPQALRIGRLAVDIAARQAAVAGRALCLTAGEYAVLELLVVRNGAPAGKSSIASRLAGEPGAAATGIEGMITRLRRKLDLAGAGGMIRTVWGQGYALSAIPLRRHGQTGQVIPFARAA